MTELLGKPRCARCGQDLTGVVEGNKCPECGGLLIDVVVRDSTPLRGKRYTTSTTLLGLPALSVALGPGANGKPGRATGWIAVGDVATGVIAIGGVARGICAFGGFSIGVFTMGGMSLGVLAALGGVALAPLGIACGGCAAGLFANGGLAAGFAATGGFSIGYYAWGAAPSATWAEHALFIRAAGTVDPAARRFFDSMAWLFGSNPAGPARDRPLTIAAVVTVAMTAVLALPAIMAWWREPQDDHADRSRRT